MSHNTGRELTLRVKIIDGEKANWIWECFGDLETARTAVAAQGVAIRAISDSNVFKERDDLREQRNWLLDQLPARAGTDLANDIEATHVEDAPWSQELVKLLRRD